jgi:hypothetical protein
MSSGDERVCVGRVQSPKQQFLIDIFRRITLDVVIYTYRLQYLPPTWPAYRGTSDARAPADLASWAATPLRPAIARTFVPRLGTTETERPDRLGCAARTSHCGS